MALASVVLDILHEAAFAAPGMIDQQFRIFPEDPVNQFRRSLRDPAHCIDAVPLQAPCCPTGHLPEVCDRLVVP